MDSNDSAKDQGTSGLYTNMTFHISNGKKIYITLIN